MKIVSWNVNGIRAIEKKGFHDWFKEEDADIVCLQEAKAQLDQLSDSLANIEGYHLYLTSGEKKGYSGVCTYTRQKPLSVKEGLNDETYNTEGRVLRLEFEDFYLYNIYFPNGASREERRQYKNGFNQALLDELKELIKRDKGIIICGDVNIAHEEIDLKNPKSNEKHSGFLPEERRYLDKLLAVGFSDSFRSLNPDTVKYSWWSYRFGARKINAGWRIDYFFVSNNLMPKVVGADIHDQVEGSDHAPIILELES